MHSYTPRHERQGSSHHREGLFMDQYAPTEERYDVAVEDAHQSDARGDLVLEAVTDDNRRDDWRYGDEPSLLSAGFTLELRNVKTAMVIAPNHPIPVAVEGLLLEHHTMPLSSEMEIILTADDREIVRERFYMPTPRRAEVMAAHAELAKMSTDFLTETRLRETAMAVYFPELAEDYDFWYRIAIDDVGVLSYALHIGPSNAQDIKKKIEGILQL
jgi:hypothetical protein